MVIARRFTIPCLVTTALALSAPVVLAADDIKRTASGHPDLSGTYDVATLTPMQRPTAFGDNLYLTQEEADEIASREVARTAASSQDSDPGREAPPDGGDGSPGAAGNVGGYNSFWIDRGTDAFTVGGKFRTSIIVDPKNGRMPPMIEEARARQAARFAGFRRGNDGTAWWLDREGPGPYDNMEQRPTAERCIMGFTGFAPTVPSLYNNYKRIVQSETHVMILIEMVHDARVVRMNSEHPPASVQKWLGDSIGWWDGDTLNVETTNFDELPGVAREGLRVVERFSPVSDQGLLYQFEVEDPDYTGTYGGELLWPKTDAHNFEYACHEGNYAMGGTLRGARLLEQEFYQEAGTSGD